MKLSQDLMTNVVQQYIVTYYEDAILWQDILTGNLYRKDGPCFVFKKSSDKVFKYESHQIFHYSKINDSIIIDTNVDSTYALYHFKDEIIYQYVVNYETDNSSSLIHVVWRAILTNEQKRHDGPCYYPLQTILPIKEISYGIVYSKDGSSIKQKCFPYSKILLEAEPKFIDYSL